MKDRAVPERLKFSYESGLGKLFYSRINLFCYIVISAFTIEIAAGFTFFRHILSPKDVPGIIIGLAVSVVILLTSRKGRGLLFYKIRAGIFSALLILIAALSAHAHPDLIVHMGITLILLAFFVSILLLPWSARETMAIGFFALVNFIFVYFNAGTFINVEILSINTVILIVATVIGVVVKRTECLLRENIFLSKTEIEEKNAVMMKELDIARKIQRSIIPQSIEHPLADIAVTYQPMFYMGGDYAKFSFIDKDKLMFIVSDITGHGVSSALLVNRIHTEIERLLSLRVSPGGLLKALGDFIDRDFGKIGFYLTAFCGMLDFSENKLVYSNHGHPPQILLQSKDNSIVLMDSQTFLMGIGLADNNVYDASISFKKGDRLILFTDGIIEAKDPSGSLFGYDNLKDFAKENMTLHVGEFNKKLLERVNVFQRDNQTDDIFLLSVQVK
ncbi:MAG: PP2C family protein-serine/threonine phosphatase [Candidatus Omnitrophica bacterium]|nr:PP2C family protein-serine/threonine phosphatase [Candidatus Omnitrophota bacterium]